MVIMGKHLTDREKKKIIADRAGGMPIRQLAQKYNVCTATIQRAIKNDPEMAQKVIQKKEENTADILSYMENQKGKVCQLLDSYLEAMGSAAKIKRAGVLQLATAMGIIIDKYTVTAQNEQALKKLDELMDKVGGVI